MATRKNFDFPGKQHQSLQNLNRSRFPPPLPPKPPQMNKEKTFLKSSSEHSLLVTTDNAPSGKFKESSMGSNHHEVYMSGYLKKSSGDLDKIQLWEQKYVEVVKAHLIWYESREKRKNDEREKSIHLPSSCVSVQDGNIIRLETDGEVRLFTAASDTHALKWALIISRYSSIPPLTEGYCEKMSGTKNCFEERYLKLTGEGILSWYKNQEESKRRGAIEIRGEKVGIVDGYKNIVFVETKEPRIYQFMFLNPPEAKFWLESFKYYSTKPKLKYTRIKIRNSQKD